jgi:hypothetical protein
MRLLAILALAGFAGCAGNPAYEHDRPAALAPVAAPAPSVGVKLEMQPLTVWTWIGEDERFLLWFVASPHVTPGRDLGAIRSADVTLDDKQLAAVACAWRMVTMGDERPCDEPRIDAMADAHDSITRAFDDLRAATAAAGGNVAGDVRCYAAQHPAHLWCEGVARVASQDPGPDFDPAAPTNRTPQLARTRFAITADASGTMFGSKLGVGTSIGFRLRPLEITGDVLDFSHDGTGRNLVGLGGTALVRVAMSGAIDAVVGGSADSVFENHSTNGVFEGWYSGFVGLAVQPSWRWYGVAQPWVQLRVGAVRAEQTTSVMVALHIGLTSPDH